MRLIKDFLIALKEVTLEYLKSRIFPVTVIIILLFCALVGTTVQAADQTG